MIPSIQQMSNVHGYTKKTHQSQQCKLKFYQNHEIKYSIIHPGIKLGKKKNIIRVFGGFRTHSGKNLINKIFRMNQ